MQLFIFVILVLAEARKQVKEATERLGGQYSPHLHPQCTHLVVQISFLFKIMLLLASFSWYIKYILGRKISIFFGRVDSINICVIPAPRRKYLMHVVLLFV